MCLGANFMDLTISRYAMLAQVVETESSTISYYIHSLSKDLPIHFRD